MTKTNLNSTAREKANTFCIETIRKEPKGKNSSKERRVVSVLRPNNASTCCPIGFDHTDVDEDDDDDDPLERGGKSGGF